VTLKATLATAVALLAALSLGFLAAHFSRAEPKSQIEQIEVGRT
jgi:hypothetical protein